MFGSRHPTDPDFWSSIGVGESEGTFWASLELYHHSPFVAPFWKWDLDFLIFPDFWIRFSHCGTKWNHLWLTKHYGYKRNEARGGETPYYAHSSKNSPHMQNRKIFYADRPTDPLLDAGNDGNQTIFYERPGRASLFCTQIMPGISASGSFGPFFNQN